MDDNAAEGILRGPVIACHTSFGLGGGRGIHVRGAGNLTLGRTEPEHGGGGGPQMERLLSATFCGQRLQWRQIDDNRHSVCSRPHLSRIVWESLGWWTPHATPRIQLAMFLLKGRHPNSPALRGPGRGPERPGPRSRIRW